MRSLPFSGVSHRPLPTTQGVRLYLEELESRTLLSAVHGLAPVLTPPTNNPVNSIALTISIVNPNSVRNFVVISNNVTQNIGSFNAVAINLVNSNSPTNSFGNANANTSSATVNSDKELQLIALSPNLASLIAFRENLASLLAYLQNAQTPPEPTLSGPPNPGPNLSGLASSIVQAHRIYPAGNPNVLFEVESQLEEPIPGAEPPPALVPDALFPTGPESIPEHKEEPTVQPSHIVEPGQQTEEARTAEDRTAELARTIQVDKTFFADRQEILEDTAAALDRALASRLQEEAQFATESEMAMIALATVNSPCGAVETPVTTGTDSP